MTARDKFEAWAVTQHFAIHRNGGEQYVNTATQHAWAGWQACWPQALQAAYDAMFDINGDKATRFDAQTAIRKLGEVL